MSYRAPAIREGVVRFVVTVAFAPEELHVLLRREGADDGWIASIVDRRGAIAARNVKPERFLGQQAPAAFLEATRGKEQGIERGVSLEGVPLMYAFSRSKVTGWTVAAGRPLSMAEAPLRTSFWVWLIVVGLLMMLGVHLARRLWVDIGLPLRALAENARALERGEPITLPPSRVREVRECSRAWEVALRAEKARRGQESLRLAAEARSRASELATREKDRLLAALSHELRNPLGAISNSVHVLEIAGPREGRVADMIAIIRRQTGHLGRLLDDLLDVARATFGKMSLLLEPLDLYLLVQQTLDAYRAGSGPMATLSLQGESVWVDADRTRLGQVVRNLIDNALKFTPAAGSIEVKVSGAGDLATLTVTDDGAGMPPELIEHLFGAFVQREQTIDRSQGGLGLGLALVRKIADLHYGTVTGESAGVGHGARFTFSLPRRAAPASPDVRGVGSPIEAVPILVVEDRPDQRESLVHLLRIMGHEVRAAGDAAQARVMLQDWQPRLIFIDLGLPGEDGIEFARSLRAQSRHAQVRIVALTAYGGGDYSARLREVGFDGKLVKPSSHAELEQLVRALPPTD
ncbi:MAG: response regulator [Proteobacteria bacterium]|nr:response regulator [Burkholderiales bacterium]